MCFGFPPIEVELVRRSVESCVDAVCAVHRHLVVCLEIHLRHNLRRGKQPLCENVKNDFTSLSRTGASLLSSDKELAGSVSELAHYSSRRDMISGCERVASLSDFTSWKAKRDDVIGYRFNELWEGWLTVPEGNIAASNID